MTTKLLKVASVAAGFISILGVLLSWFAGHAGWSSRPSDILFYTPYLLFMALPAFLIATVLAIVAKGRGDR